MRIIFFTLVTITFFLFLSCSEDSSTESGGTSLSGTVVIKSTQQPVSGAKVFLGNEYETTTDGSGKYKLSDVPTVKQALRVEMSPYAVFIEDVTPVDGENTFDVELETHVEYCNRVKSVDYQGRTYETVLVGEQCWFKKNLNVGNMVNLSTGQTQNATIEKYCLNNNVSNCTELGALYTWDEAMNYLSEHSNQGICPDGWYIPTIDDFHTLGEFVNEDGNALKAVGVGDEEGIGTNESGWSALRSGSTFQDFAYTGPLVFVSTPRFWSSTETDDLTSDCFGLNGGLPNTNYPQFPKTWAMGIRCIKK